MGSVLIWDVGPGLAPGQAAPRGGPTVELGHYRDYWQLCTRARESYNEALGSVSSADCAIAGARLFILPANKRDCAAHGGEQPIHSESHDDFEVYSR